MAKLHFNQELPGILILRNVLALSLLCRKLIGPSVICGAALLAGCARSPISSVPTSLAQTTAAATLGLLTESNVNKLQIGMTERELIPLFGSPHNEQVESQKKIELWHEGQRSLEVKLVDGALHAAVFMSGPIALELTHESIDQVRLGMIYLDVAKLLGPFQRMELNADGSKVLHWIRGGANIQLTFSSNILTNLRMQDVK